MKYTRTRSLIVAAISHIPAVFISIWTIAFTEICEWVKIIGGSIYLAVLIYSIFFVLKRRKYGVEGIVRVHSKDHNYSDIANMLDKAKHSIEIIVYHGNNILRCTKECLVEALKRDVDVKLLIAGKESPLLKETWDMEGDDKDDEYESAWKILKQIKKEAKGKTCSLKYYKYNTQARYALIIVDGKWAWWTPYHPGLNVPETTSFLLLNTGDNSIIQECKKHFRILWLKLEKKQNKQI